MTPSDVLIDAYDRVARLVHEATVGLTAEELAFRPEADANSIAWLVWHLTRVLDDHVAALAGDERIWLANGWHARFGMPPTTDAGVGHTSEQVAAVRPADAEVLLDYHDAVAGRARAYFAAISATELDRVLDESADPPMTVGHRVVTILSGVLQHVGQARYVRGVVDRRS